MPTGFPFCHRIQSDTLNAAHHICCALEYAVDRSVCGEADAPSHRPRGVHQTLCRLSVSPQDWLHDWLTRACMNCFAFSGPTPSSSSSPGPHHRLVQHLPRGGLPCGGSDRSRLSCACTACRFASHTGMRCFRTTNAPEPPQARSRERPLCSTLSVRVTKYTPAPLGAATGLRGEKLTIFATLDISTLQNAATVKFLE